MGLATSAQALTTLSGGKSVNAPSKTAKGQSLFFCPLFLSEILLSFLKYSPSISVSQHHFLPSTCHNLKLSRRLNLFVYHFLSQLTLHFMRAWTWSVLFTLQPGTWTNAWYMAILDKRLLRDRQIPCLLPASSPQLTRTVTISPTLPPSLQWILLAPPMSVFSGWDQYHPHSQRPDLMG